MEKESLMEFILKAHQHTYAAPKEIKRQYRCTTPILTGHKDYQFVDGDWSYPDSYAGSAWAPGREVVFYKDQPVWCMSYQGKHNQSFTEEFIQQQAFPFLQKALRTITPDSPFRGPPYYEDGDFVYEFTMNGDYTYFTGRESVKFKGTEVFFQNIMGELIK